MKSITIYKLDDELVGRIASLSEETGLSQNKIIKKLLRQALNIDHVPEKRRDLSCVAGIWDQSQLDEFQSSQAVFREIDMELW